MKKSVKEFIIKEHANACSEWKQKIEEKYPEVFKTGFKRGDWVKLTSDYIGCLKKGDVYQIVQAQDNANWCYIVDHLAFNKMAEEGKNFLAPWASFLTPATNKEVETALIAEAKRRGFKEGVEVEEPENVNNQETGKILNNCFVYENNRLATGGLLVFKDGKWAEIIEEEKPEEKTQTLTDADIKAIINAFNNSKKPIYIDYESGLKIEITKL